MTTPVSGTVSVAALPTTDCALPQATEVHQSATLPEPAQLHASVRPPLLPREPSDGGPVTRSVAWFRPSRPCVVVHLAYRFLEVV